MTLTLSMFKLPTLKLFFQQADVAPADGKTPVHVEPWEERVFLRELMSQCPEAFQSELGLMAMMSQYPRNF